MYMEVRSRFPWPTEHNSGKTLHWIQTLEAPGERRAKEKKKEKDTKKKGKKH